MVARQKIHAGMIHAGKTATVICENNHFRVVIDGETAAVVPRTTTSEVHRYKANATDKRIPGPALPRKDGDPHARSRDWTPPTPPSSRRCCNSSANGWPATPAASPHRWQQFVGHPAYGLNELRSDLERFVFLLGGSDGEPLFGRNRARRIEELVVSLWPQLDALLGRVQDRLRVEAGTRLGDVSSGPFAHKGHRPSRRQRPDPVTPLPVTQAATQAERAQHQAWWPGIPGRFRPGGEVGGLLAVGELQANIEPIPEAPCPRARAAERGGTGR